MAYLPHTWKIGTISSAEPGTDYVVSSSDRGVALLGIHRLQVNWGKRNKFHLEEVIRVLCVDDPGIGPNPPDAGFDTHGGMGTGRYNGLQDATIEWVFTDAGEPGKEDTATIVIRDGSGGIVLSVSGSLNRGNHQAHKE